MILIHFVSHHLGAEQPSILNHSMRPDLLKQPLRAGWGQKRWMERSKIPHERHWVKSLHVITLADWQCKLVCWSTNCLFQSISSIEFGSPLSYEMVIFNRKSNVFRSFSVKRALSPGVCKIQVNVSRRQAFGGDAICDCLWGDWCGTIWSRPFWWWLNRQNIIHTIKLEFTYFFWVSKTLNTFHKLEHNSPGLAKPLLQRTFLLHRPTWMPTVRWPLRAGWRHIRKKHHGNDQADAFMPM